MTHKIIIIGAGLAGSEAAWSCVGLGCEVELYEMRGDLAGSSTPAHQSDQCAELVCSNSFRSDDHRQNAVGLLHDELRNAGSLIMECADLHKVPAGGALAVDRDLFAGEVTKKLQAHPNIKITREEIADPLILAKEAPVIIATGPLTADKLSAHIRELTGDNGLAFFDAIAPIIYRDSINMDIAWFQSRYDKEGPGGEKDAYINCPLNEREYLQFIDALTQAQVTEFKDWEKDTPYFEACLPIEVMASRGPQTLRYGPMKPVGLTNPHRPEEKAYAVVQLRQDNQSGSLYNMVGFQTKMTYGAQTELLRTIPGLEKAKFARLGGIHRNSFINSPALLEPDLALRKYSGLYFAGQITGVEGYVESTAMGLLAGRAAAAKAKGEVFSPPPATTAMGALLHYITGGHSQAGAKTFQPMNVNFGLFEAIEGAVIDPETGKRARGKRKGILRKQAFTDRGKADFMHWLTSNAHHPL